VNLGQKLRAGILTESLLSSEVRTASFKIRGYYKSFASFCETVYTCVEKFMIAVGKDTLLQLYIVLGMPTFVNAVKLGDFQVADFYSASK
jgi:hypothetical protein